MNTFAATSFPYTLLLGQLESAMASWGDSTFDGSSEPQSPHSPQGENVPTADPWAKAKLTFEYEEVDGVRFRVTKQVREYKVTRPFTMVDHRTTWKKFGDAADAANNDLATAEALVVLELGEVDPLEKQCRDEMARMWGDVERMTVTVKDPNLARYAITAQQAKSAAAAAAAQAAAASPAASPTDDGKAKTWGQAQKDRREGEKTTEVAKDSSDTLSKKVVRISNLSDFITEPELRRLFGEENGLPAIQRLFVAVDKTTGQRRGFAYITYKSDADGERVVSKMNPTRFKNTVLRVDYGTNKK
ncbi:translation initiation factor 3 subunit G, putative [Bodo saltans]|uniref:Translation initiation factor 3 subunit G, putative n=1 Tax=Bodo saltans TaxID=75058 RepID=A0A0S4JUP4_BODSA|nr:translation initiation factor 3 subunit G, putative [Bodo saltans]|eukprot:CUG93753.1 translation initiation factor 3 subunit G, putative [Bodo saltans]